VSDGRRLPKPTSQFSLGIPNSASSAPWSSTPSLQRSVSWAMRCVSSPSGLKGLPSSRRAQTGIAHAGDTQARLDRCVPSTCRVAVIPPPCAVLLSSRTREATTAAAAGGRAGAGAGRRAGPRKFGHADAHGVGARVDGGGAASRMLRCVQRQGAPPAPPPFAFVCFYSAGDCKLYTSTHKLGSHLGLG